MPRGLSPGVRRWISLLTACLQAFCTGTFLSVGAMALDLKAKFNLKQEEYGLASILYMVGSISFILTGPLVDRFGPTVTSCVAMVLTVSGHLGLWLVEKYPFEKQQLVIYVLFLVSGQGLSAMYTSASWTSLANFGKDKHGRILGALVTCIFLGASATTIMYQEIFSPQLGNYFLTMGIAFGLINILAIIFVRKIADDETGSGSGSGYEPIENETQKHETGNANEGSRWPFWLKLDFQLLIWVYAISVGVTHIVLIMSSIFAQSLNFEKFITPLAFSTPFTTAGLIITTGFLSDYLLRFCTRLTIALVYNLLFAVFVLLCIGFIDKLPILSLLTITTSGSMVTINLLVPSEFHRLHGERLFGTSMGIASVLSSIMMLVLQYGVSWFYDRQLKRQHESGNVCYGKDCFRDGFILLSVLAGVIVLCNVFYVYRQKENKCVS